MHIENNIESDYITSIPREIVHTRTQHVHIILIVNVTFAINIASINHVLNSDQVWLKDRSSLVAGSKNLSAPDAFVK